MGAAVGTLTQQALGVLALAVAGGLAVCVFVHGMLRLLAGSPGIEADDSCCPECGEWRDLCHCPDPSDPDDG